MLEDFWTNTRSIPVKFHRWSFKPVNGRLWWTFQGKPVNLANWCTRLSVKSPPNVPNWRTFSRTWVGILLDTWPPKNVALAQISHLHRDEIHVGVQRAQDGHHPRVPGRQAVYQVHQHDDEWHHFPPRREPRRPEGWSLHRSLKISEKIFRFQKLTRRFNRVGFLRALFNIRC